MIAKAIYESSLILIYLKFYLSCLLRVPGNTTIPGPVWGEYNISFYIPFKDYAFAALHASRLMDDAAENGIGPRLSPSFIFATALKESYLGCNN